MSSNELQSIADCSCKVVSKFLQWKTRLESEAFNSCRDVTFGGHYKWIPAQALQYLNTSMRTSPPRQFLLDTKKKAIVYIFEGELGTIQQTFSVMYVPDCYRNHDVLFSMINASMYCGSGSDDDVDEVLVILKV